MARPTILLLSALLLAATHSSACKHHGQEEESSSSRCERKVERLNLRYCERHIIQRIQQQQQEEEDEDNWGIRNPGFRSGNSKQRCCNQLKELEDESPRCMCEALQQIMENQREELERSQIQEAKRELRNLPNRCNLHAPRQCDLSEQDN